MWSDIITLDKLRSKAAAARTGTITVSIEDLNAIKDELASKMGNEPTVEADGRTEGVCVACEQVINDDGSCNCLED